MKPSGTNGPIGDIHRNVLVVDDDADFRDFISGIFKINFGFTPYLASSAMEALAQLRNSPIRLLISDTNMPKMSGVDLLLEAKNFDPSLKVILLFSGLHDSKICEEELLRLGAYDVMEKTEISFRLQGILGSLQVDR